LAEPITTPFLDRRSRRGGLEREMLAIAWLTALREETEKAKGCSMRSMVYFSGALGLAVIEWQLGAGNGTRARLEDGVNLRTAFAGRRGYITPLYFLL
jgi:hypothetical protein